MRRAGRASVAYSVAYSVSDPAVRAAGQVRVASN